MFDPCAEDDSPLARSFDVPRPVRSLIDAIVPTMRTIDPFVAVASSPMKAYPSSPLIAISSLKAMSPSSAPPPRPLLFDPEEEEEPEEEESLSRRSESQFITCDSVRGSLSPSIIRVGVPFT